MVRFFPLGAPTGMRTCNSERDEMQIENGYRYYAFISYNHRDEKVAKWLQSRLEHYKLPSVARKEIGEDVKIRPVFRYVSDLGVAVLREKLREELDASKYLIVVCSPHSAKPNVKGEHWVNDEVGHFIELGRKDRIIPVIVDGEPGDAERECFCPALAEAEISGVDFQKEKKGICIQKIVAKLLDLRPDILIQRYREEQRKKRARFFFGLLPFLALLAVGGLFAWDASRPTSNYYVNYVDSYGLPQGVFELSEKDLPGRYVHYRFEYEGIRFGEPFHADSSSWSFIRLFGFHRVLRRVVQAAANGRPRKWNHTEYGFRPPVQEFTVYDDRGIVREIRYWDFVGDGSALRMNKRLRLSDNDGVVNGLLTFKGKDDRSFLFARAETTTLASNEGLGVPRSVIAQHVFTRTADGRIATTRFLDAFAKPAPDGDGIWGFRFEHDGLGRVKALWYLAPDGETREPNKNGVAGKRYEYDGHVMKRAEYVDAKGVPTISHHGWMACVDEFDGRDNNTGSTYYDADGKVMTLAQGYAGYKATFEAGGAGERSSVTYVDANGKPVMRADGFCTIRLEYDDCGRETSLTLLDEKGNPVRNGVIGCAVMRSEYDADTGFRTAYRRFGPDGTTPTCDESGVCSVKEARDDEGRVTSSIYLGTNGMPTVSSDGYCEVRFAYGEGGSVTNYSFFGTNGCAVADRYGVASVSLEYDDFGNERRRRFFGLDGKPCANTDGEAGYDREYENGHVTKFTNVGIDGKTVLSADGFAFYTCSYDTRGNETERRYFDAEGNLILQPEGYAVVRSEYDSVGRIAEKSYFDGEGHRVGGKDNVARVKFEYDVCGHVLERRYYGVDGNPVYHTDGEAGSSSRYDSRGNETNRVYLAADGKTPTGSEYGIVQSRWAYDLCGRAVRMDYLDAEGRPMLSKEMYAGWTKQYDSRGRMVRTAAHGVDGKPCLAKVGVTGYSCAYDVYGKETQRRYFGPDGKPCMVGQGDVDEDSAGWDKTFDPCGRLLSQKWLDVRGNPVMRADGYAEIRHRYDEAGRLVATAYFGTNGMAVAASEGVAEIRYVRDDRGNCVDTLYLDVDGRPAVKKGEAYTAIHREYDSHNKIQSQEFRKDGRRVVADEDTGLCGFRYVYDKNLRETESIAYGKDGTPATLTGGYARRERAYDKYGRQVSEIHYDINGNVMLWNWREKYAYSVSTFDASGRETSRRYYGADRKPCRVEGEEFGWDAEFDSSGRMTRIMWVGSNGKPAKDGNGVAGARFTYGPDGRMASKTWLDVNEKPTVHREGNAGYRVKHNDRGKETLREFLDERGELTPMGRSGYVGWTNEYDTAGNLVGELWFDANRHPANNGKGYARTRMEYDSKGHLVREWRYDSDDRPVPVRPEENVGTVLKTFDAQERVTSERYFDLEGKPCLCKSGYWGWDAEISEDGRRHVISYVGLDGKPKADGRGCARVVNEFDAYKHPTLREYRGLDGKLVAIDTDGEAGLRCRHDLAGRETMREYFGVDGKPIFCSAGYSRFEKSYDARGNVTCTIYFDEKGNVILGNKEEKYAFAVKTFDLDGRETSRRYYGTDRRPCQVSGELYGWDKTFDQQGRDLRIMWVGPDGKPAAGKNDVAGRKFEYDGARKYWYMATWLDADGKPTRHRDGAVVTKRVIDSNGNVTLRKFFEQDGTTPAAVEASGLVGWRSTYDDNGNEVYRQNFGKDEMPIDNDEGWASFQKKYDEKGRVVQAWFLNHNGNPIPVDAEMKVYSVEKKFDGNGNAIRVVYYGADREPCQNAEGITGYDAWFDVNNREVARRFFGLDGNPAAVGGRFFGWNKTYDQYGNETARIEVDANGAVIPDPDAEGAAYRTSVFDSRGREIGWYNCDTNRQPTVDRDGVAGVKISRDGFGRIIRLDYMGPDGTAHASPISHVAGYKVEYSAGGSRKTLWWLGEDGSVTRHADGNAGVIEHLDSRGRTTQREFVDANGRVTALDDGRAREIWIYGADGELVTHQILDINGKPVGKSRESTR